VWSLFWHTFGMLSFGRLGLRSLQLARSAGLLMCALGLAGQWSGAVLVAQDAPVPKDEPITTLHVYANLIQIPTLVLGANRERLKTPIAESRFSISIDFGRLFRPTHVRLEGDDPISLSILLDTSGGTAELMPKIGNAIARLAPLSLHPKDHVSIYAMDCSLVQASNDVPAESQGLKTAVDSALQSWAARRQNEHEPKCEQSVHLWDALAQMSGQLSKLPGRRVILAVSSGYDKGSRYTWNQTRALAESRGVAVFGLDYIPQFARDTTQMILKRSSEDAFLSVCELSGGIILSANTRSIDEALKRFVEMLRERYIVEFPRPANATAGVHVKEVKIARSNAFIRPAGTSVPIADPALLGDPTTVPSDPTRAPEAGTRMPMKKPQ
jgi:hypothetical protein